jgi:hypothetical protein
VSKWTALLAQGRDSTLAAVAYLVPLVGSGDRLEPMELPHTTMPPQPPAGAGFRQAVHAVGSERGTLQLAAGGRGIVARQIANQLETTSYRELHSDIIAHRRASAGRTGARSTRKPIWLFAGDQGVAPSKPPKSMADALAPCSDCG